MKYVSKTALRTKRRKLLAIIILLIIAGLCWGVHWLSSPSRGVVVDKPDPAIIPKKTDRPPGSPSAPQPTAIDSRYFTLSLPVGYGPPNPGALPAGLLYQTTLIKTGRMGSLVINISLRQLPEGGLSEDTDYRLRDSQPNNYQFSHLKAGGNQNVPVATDVRGGSVVGFWVHGNLLAKIAVISGVSSDSVDSTETMAALQTVLQSWQWR